MRPTLRPVLQPLEGPIALKLEETPTWPPLTSPQLALTIPTIGTLWLNVAYSIRTKCSSMVGHKMPWLGLTMPIALSSLVTLLLLWLRWAILVLSLGARGRSERIVGLWTDNDDLGFLLFFSPSNFINSMVLY